MNEPKQIKQNRKEAEKRLSEKVEEIKADYNNEHLTCGCGALFELECICDELNE